MNKKLFYKNNIPKVSIIVTTFNRGRYIHEAINSIQDMSFKDWELIIVDDGSNDQTNQVIDKYLNDERIQYLYKETNQGVSIARNIGLQKSKGRYIAYLDSDNLYDKNFMSYAIKFLEKNNNFDLVYGSLLTGLHGEKNKPILFKEFSRELLLNQNYIDLNTVIHRRKLYELLGGFDESLDRLTDWDLLLKYSKKNNFKGLAIVAAKYRELDELRITKNKLLYTNVVKILNKWPPNNHHTSSIKVLYVLSSYPQSSETYVETELKKMRDWGCVIEVWRKNKPFSPYPSDIPTHDEDLRDVINKIKPDLIHIHWLSFAKLILPLIDDLHIPTTIRAHGFDTTEETLKFCTARPYVKKIYCFPQHINDFKNDKLEIQNAVFNTKLFKPHKNKNKHLVVRGAACLRTKDLVSFIHLAKELPKFKFILALVKCLPDHDDYINELKRLASEINSPVEIKTDLPKESYINLVNEAGIYFYSYDSKNPVGMPVGISEAMATGCYIVSKNSKAINDYISVAGKTYNDISEAKKIIKNTESWKDDGWNEAWKNSVERAFSNDADEIILRPMFLDWVSISKQEKTKNRSSNLSLDEKDAKIQSLKQSLQEKDIKIQSSNLSLDEKDAKIQSIKQSLQEKDIKIQSLNNSLQDILSSNSWKITWILRKFKDLLIKRFKR